ncbi:cilia- and flagella-associated protein 58-like [Lucilia cuprina]|uniref:cilia- and flagella-associated protein 58-like n=1 Tax=Lucilia cuprina TaxID=7375 RepID=UPI001F062A1A|nr:cilia- and flagella-associated protein 58-like [Lucilia cuprina]
MPPKKTASENGKKDKKDKKKKEPEPEPEPPLQDSLMSVVEKDLDLIKDLNEDFFARANKIIQMLMERGRTFEASKIKQYTDIIFKLHRKYVEEVKENEELKPQVAQADAKLRIALELTANSEEAMQHLKKALSDAWHESDAALTREQEIQEKFQEVLVKCENFENKETKQDENAEFGHLSKYKNIILRERDRINGEVIDLEKRLQLQRYYSESLEYIIHNHVDSINKMGTRVRVMDAEKQSLDTKVRTLINNLEDQKDINNKTLIKLDSTLRELNETHSKLAKKTAEYDRLKLVAEKLKNDNSLHLKQLAKYEDDIVVLHKEQKETEELIRSLRLEDKVKCNTITQLNNKYKKSVQDHSAVSSKLYKINRINNGLNEDIVRYKNQTNSLEKDLLNSAQKFDELRRLKDNIQRERDNLRSDIVKLNNQIADLRHSIMMQSNTIDSLHLDINKLNVKLDEAKINIAKAEKERDEMAQEVETLHEKIEYYQDQIQLKTDQVTDLSEKLQQKQFQLINMKKQLETVHSEKMILQRSLETCTQERDNFRLLQTKTTHQITQLTNEISANQNKINSLNLRIERLNNDKKELQSELKNTENVLASVRKDLKEMKSKNENLLKTISDDELKFMKISQDLDETRKEKNLIGLQMVRRNDEIVLLKEKLSITQTALDQGQTQYNQRIEDIRLLKLEITNLQTERECLSRALKSTANMREEIIRLQRSLNQERVRVRSLTEDAKTPTGVHRWRILKGQDPNKFELLAKVQMLQRRTLKQEIEKTNLQRQLEESHKVSETLKRIVENMPTTKVKQKLVETQRINKRQLKKLKALNAELAIDEIELKARECIIEEFKATLKLTKEQLCGAGDVSTVNTSRPEINDYTSQENYIDCVFSASGDSQKSEANQKDLKDNETNKKPIDK